MAIAEALENAITSQDGTSHGTPSQAQDQADQGQANGPLELDKVDRFIFQGHEWTPDELSAATLRQADYTRKTQEIAQERKFVENLKADLENVKQDHSLAEQFKKIYPPKFHAFLDVILEEQREAELDDRDESEVQLPKHILAKLKKLDDIERKLSKVDEFERESQARELAAADKHLDVVFSKMGEKYPYAVEDTVLNRAQALLEANRENPRFAITDAVWERIFRQVNSEYEKKYESKYRSRLETQISKSKKASDSAPGGAAPGRAQKKISFDEATEMMIQDLSRR